MCEVDNNIIIIELSFSSNAPLSAWKSNPSEIPMLPHAPSHKGLDLIGFTCKLSANSQSSSDG